MEASMIELLEELSDSILRFLPYVIVAGVLPPAIRFLFRSFDYSLSDNDSDIFTKPDLQEVKEPEEPEKPEEVIIKPVKMQPVTKVKEVPKFCSYCAGVPDNDERCSYCGIKF